MEVEPVTAPPVGRFPPRSSSYRAYSIIDAYGGDPGIQFSPVEEEIPIAPPPQTVLNSVRKQLRTEDVMSSYYNFDIDETYGSSYGSDPERMTMAMEDDYDPYRQIEPVHTPKSKIETGEQTKKHVKTLPSRPNEGIVKGKGTTPATEKELPRPPVPLGVLEKRQDGDLGRGLKTSLRVESRGLAKDSPTTSPLSARSMKELPMIEKPLPIPSLPLQLAEEGTPAPRSISRSTKPPSLRLANSNGSTAASIISSSSSLSLSSTIQADPSPKYGQRSSRQQFHTRSSSLLSKELLPTTTYSPHDRPLPELPPQQEEALVHPAHRNNFSIDSVAASVQSFASAVRVVPSDDSPALADDEASMRRLKNLVVRRKPVQGDATPPMVSTASSNNLLHKENRAMFSSPSLPTVLSDKTFGSRQSATMTSPSKPRAHIRDLVSPPAQSQAPMDTKVNNSVEPVIKTPNEGHSMGSSADEGTVIAHKQSRSASPPILLPAPSPVLEESPSRYGLKKKSEKNLRKPVPSSPSASTVLGLNANGHDLFISATSRLQSHFAVVHSTLQSPLASEDIIVQNETEWVNNYHISTLNLMRDRPVDTNAPKLSTIQIHCQDDHSRWVGSHNHLHPIDCALCYQSPADTAWQSCSSCALRVCTACRERIDQARVNTEFARQLEANREGWPEQLQRSDRVQQQLMMTRPASPAASIYYDYPIPQPLLSADVHSRSPSAMSMRSVRSMGTLRPRGRPYGGPQRGGFMPPGPRRFSDSRNIPALADYPPLPRMPPVFRDEYDSGSGSPSRAPPRGRLRGRNPPGSSQSQQPMLDINYGLGGDQGRMPTGMAMAGGMPGVPMPTTRSRIPYEVY